MLWVSAEFNSCDTGNGRAGRKRKAKTPEWAADSSGPEASSDADDLVRFLPAHASCKLSVRTPVPFSVLLLASRQDAFMVIATYFLAR